VTKWKTPALCGRPAPQQTRAPGTGGGAKRRRRLDKKLDRKWTMLPWGLLRRL